MSTKRTESETVDPGNQQSDRRGTASVTLQDALDLYIDRGYRKGLLPKTLTQCERALRLHCNDWMDWPLQRLAQERECILERHETITARGAPVSANQVVRLLSRVYRIAARRYPGLPPCPTDIVELNPERPREEFIPDWPAWWNQTGLMPNGVLRDYFRFLAFSGMRRAAAREVRREHVRLEAGFILVPRPKGGPSRAFQLPLSTILKRLVAARLASNDERYPGSPWLFPSAWSASGHLEGCHVSSLPSPHVHRHSYASAAAASGLDELDIKLLLNHRVPGVTGRYLHESALSDRLLASQEKVSAWIMRRILRSSAVHEAGSIGGSVQ